MNKYLNLSILTVASTLALSPADSSASYDSRWAVTAEANQRVARHLGGTVNDKVLDKLSQDMEELRAACDKLPKKIERSGCREDLMRLEALAMASVQPDSPDRNPRFPTNIPDFVSPEMKQVMAKWTPYWLADGFPGLPDPKDKAAWQFETLHGMVIGPAAEAGKALLASLDVTTEEEFHNKVRAVRLKPAENRHPGKVLIHVHGGAFYANTPETTFDRTAPLSNLMGIEIVSVDYKLMPGKPGEDWDLLNQRDQIIDVFDALVSKGGYKPENVGIYGCSAGSGLVAMATNEMSKRGGAMPAAAVVQGAMVDFTFDSDSYTTLRYDDPRTQVDMLISHVWPMLGMDGDKAYDPRYSTVLDNFDGRKMPPTMVQVGTKEIQMSDGIRYYDVLRRAGNEVQLDVHDAMQHCFHGHWGTPEAKVAVERVAEWFEAHLRSK